MMVAEDTEVPLIVRTIIQINKSEHHGDAVFICPLADAIRTGQGNGEPKQWYNV